MNSSLNKIVFIIAAFSVLLSVPDLNSGQTESHLQSAKEKLYNGNFSQLNSQIKDFLQQQPEDPVANILWGLSLLTGDIEQKREAKEIIEKYAHRREEDPFCNYALGILYKIRNNHPTARKYFMKALEYDDAFVPALVELGENYYRDVIRYYYRYSNTEIPLTFRQYAMEDYDFAVSYLKKALRLDPSNREAAYVLGSLYYELEDYEYMVDLFEDLLETYPEDKDLNLFMGLAHLARNDFDAASSYFDRAVRQFTEEEIEQFYHPGYLVRNKKSIDSDRKKNLFWKQKDPMFLTAENERLLEHLGRFAFANLRFSAPKLDVPGWKTDRGKTYIRYGKPRFIVEYGKTMEFNAIYPPMQIWIYPEFQLAFSDPFWNGLFQFTEPDLNQKSAFKERTRVNYTLVAENIFATDQESFELEFPGGLFFAPYQIKFFKERDGAEGLLSFALPAEQDLYHPRQDFQAGLFVLNDNRLPEKKFHKNLSMDFSKTETLSDAGAVQHLSFVHQPGHYPYSFEILNETLDKNFVDRQEIDIPDFSGDSLLISDILVANSISTAAAPSSLVRNGLSMIPNVQQAFQPEDTLYIYFEIYNLTPDMEGNVYYKVENAIGEADQGGFLDGIFGSDEKSVSFINEYSGRKTSDFVVQNIELINLPPGEYLLEIVLTDNFIDKSISKQTRIRIIETLTN